MPQTYNYHIYHATGFYIVTVQAESDQHFSSLLDTGAIPEIKPYVFIRVFSDDIPESTYPNIKARPATFRQPPPNN